MTKIEWSDTTWNPVRGCTRVSEGCRNCYAERQSARRLPGLNSPTTGRPFAEMTSAGPRWTGKVELMSHKLAEPLHWKKPRRIFVNSMSDLFHEELTFEEIAAVFGVMAAVPHITFQVLTKRPTQAALFYDWVHSERDRLGDGSESWLCAMLARDRRGLSWDETERLDEVALGPPPWPLQNFWLGVSVEDQETADERIPLLLQIPASLRFVSYEPALGPVDFARIGGDQFGWGSIDALSGFRRLRCNAVEEGSEWETEDIGSRIDLLIAGGESGPGARLCNLAWLRSARDQCREAGTAYFLKQLGSNPIDFDPRHEWWDGEDFHTGGLARLLLKHPKGGDEDEWPADLQGCREMPEVRKC